MSCNGTQPQLSEAAGANLPKPLQGLHTLLHAPAEAHPERTAIVARHQPSDLYSFVHEDDGQASGPYLRWTFRSFQKAVRTLARSLQALGVSKDTTIAIVLPGGVEFFVTYHAALLLGVPIAPISARTLINRDEATHMLKTSGAKVVITDDAQTASSLQQLIDESKLAVHIKIAVSPDERQKDWRSFTELLEPGHLDMKNGQLSAPQYSDSDLCIVAFTSGTTSLPKGCPLTNKSIKTMVSAVKDRSPIDHTSSICMTMPHNHLIGLLYLLSYPSVGAAVVFPAPSFDASAVLLAFEEDRCTNFIGVPTMLHALLDRMQGGKHSFRLRQADIAGAAVSAHHMRQVTHELGAEKVGTSFGMTEGTPIRAAPVSDPEELIRGDIVLCGKPLSGARVRICEHGTERVLPRGEYGELHQSGDQLIDHYIGIDESKDFYFDDSGRKWFRSGDQAVMMEDDAVSIVGRYKDMIIRGGENISPAVIERVLNGLPGVNAQVIGCMDEIAGEVPVAVYQCSQAVSLDSMQDLILKHLGSTYVPSDFFSLHELGIEDFPKTVSGKVQKPELARIVREHLKTREQPVVNGYHEPLREHILRIWASLIGISAENLDIRSSVSDFADSITIMRFRDKIRKETGRQISLEDMIANDSISAQTEFLQKQNVGQDKSTPSIVLGRSGPPKAQDMIHTGGDEALAKETRALVEGIIEPHGFTWNEDVEDVMPAYDFIQTLYTLQRPTSHSRRHTLITKSHDVETLHAALRATVTKHSVMRSFFIRQNIGTQDEQAFYVSMRPTDRWFSKAITENGKISTIADLKRFAADDPALDHSFPGPLYRAMIFHVEETGTAGFAHNGNHVTFDAMAVRLYVEDLEKALSSQNAVLQDHIPFKFWADTYYSLRDSLTAQRAVKFQVQRLAALSKHCKALFPPQRAPKWFLGPHRDWKPTEEDIKKGYENLNRAWLSQPSSYETNGITWRGELPSLKKLRDAVPELSAPVTAKAAFAMMLAHYTNHTHALFALVEAARGSLPFVPDHISSQLDHIACADVSGPCFEILTDLVEVDRNETLTNFLKRLQNEQLHITKNAHAPVRKVVEALGTNAEGTGSGDVYLEAMRRVQFNWAPGAGNTGDGPEPNIRPLLGNSLTDIGLAILAGAGGANGTTCTLNIRWDDANVTREEAEGMIGDMSKIWTWITEGGPWDRPVGGFTEYL